MTQTYVFSAKVWLYAGRSAWHFVTLPTEVAQSIDFYFSWAKRGWGSLPVHVTVGQTRWKTSIFADKQLHSYLLPLKAEVRKRENITVDALIEFELEVSDLLDWL